MLQPSAASDVIIRPPRIGDGVGMAQAWMDAGRYYAELNPELFQIPEEAGLAEWMEEIALSTAAEDSLVRVADLAGEAVGYIWASFARPIPTSSRQFVRYVTLPRLEIAVLVVQRTHWRRGIGTKLLRVAEKWGQEKGAIVSLVDTYIGSPLSVPFYEKRMGYHRRAIHFYKVSDSQSGR